MEDINPHGQILAWEIIRVRSHRLNHIRQYYQRYTLTHSSWHVCVDVASRTIRLNTSLFWASLSASVALICSHSLMSSVHLLVGRPFLLLPSSLAFNMCFSRESCLFRWPKYDVSLLWCCSPVLCWQKTNRTFHILVLLLPAPKVHNS